MKCTSGQRPSVGDRLGRDPSMIVGPVCVGRQTAKSRASFAQVGISKAVVRFGSLLRWMSRKRLHLCTRPCWMSCEVAWIIRAKIKAARCVLNRARHGLESTPAPCLWVRWRASPALYPCGTRHGLKPGMDQLCCAPGAVRPVVDNLIFQYSKAGDSFKSLPCCPTKNGPGRQ
jgi:hypothetical protein